MRRLLTYISEAVADNKVNPEIIPQGIFLSRSRHVEVGGSVK